MRVLAMNCAAVTALTGILHTFSAGAAASPFFMFSASQAGSAVDSVLAEYVRPEDYLAAPVVRNDPALAERLSSSHIYALVPNLAGVERQCRSGAAMVIYDGEHWPSTPADEQDDMPAAIARGKSIASSRGCAYGVTPDGEYVGLIPKRCGYDLQRAIHREIDWDDIALFNVQAQRLLSDRCAAQGGMAGFVTLVTAVAQEVRAKNPETKIAAQFSFRYTPPQRMIEAMHRLRGVVDGFYIAYPAERGSCSYCSPQNLSEVLAALREL
jgi:hypothetical protein